ncbi:MAG: septal ring factor EnvC (AmiA/AmiB activator) [Gammaproteobacteria bacterium]|jgi:septal ring factor EnvC (AmiA/AmiB activator)
MKLSHTLSKTTGTVPLTENFFLICFLLIALIINNQVIAIDINTEQIEKDHKLQNIRTQIKDVESSIETAKLNVDELFRQLQNNELSTTEAADKIHHFQQQINDKDNELVQLARNKTAQEALLVTLRQQLAQTIRAAYKTGRNNYVKLLLNQQAPDRVGRMLVYYEYDVQARSKRISDISIALAEISSLEQRMQTETRALRKLQSDHKSKLTEFQAYRVSRSAITNKLQDYIDAQGAQLQILQGNEQDLARLVNDLKQQDLAIQIFEEMPPFNSLQGKLDWPVKGKVASRYGSLRKGGKLKWQGVTIDADNGVEVKAISTGKVVFADWFRNMGLLMILDHGDGFMSLYGHNERLLKKSGDWVLAGDLIARVGDTGGQSKPGLYFEIRQSGNPINPNLWCGK